MMTAEAREQKNAYKRAWYQKNKDKVRGYNEKYWQRLAAKAEAERKTQNEKD